MDTPMRNLIIVIVLAFLSELVLLGLCTQDKACYYWVPRTALVLAGALLFLLAWMGRNSASDRLDELLIHKQSVPFLVPVFDDRHLLVLVVG